MPRLLATQSHVVHGYVGNKAATFPLQCLGWDVDCCNSVQFSNHTGYGLDKVFGTITRETDLKELLSGLFDNFSQDYQALLSGYLPNKNSVRCMGTYYAKFKEANPEMIWLMDPVMGDEGQLYVSEDVIPEYRKLALSPKQLVDIITPNQFELEILYGGEIKTKEHLKKALKKLHQTIPVIIVTSCDCKMFDDKDFIYCVASMEGKTPIVYRVPFIDSYFTGVGDLFSALLLDRVYKILSNPTTTLKFEDQVNNVLNVIQKVLKITRSYASGKMKAKMGSALEMKEMELRLIESRDIYATINIHQTDYIYARL
ncbi:BBF_collapsed_G0014410.mRNA.1.CDS.1 [Saccharomyces cerevisiae]|nr:BBF_collapsed_G0014410.mRNA.1.CDS.1 [Saccharomyces cerevisiae]